MYNGVVEKKFVRKGAAIQRSNRNKLYFKCSSSTSGSRLLTSSITASRVALGAIRQASTSSNAKSPFFLVCSLLSPPVKSLVRSSCGTQPHSCISTSPRGIFNAGKAINRLAEMVTSSFVSRASDRISLPKTVVSGQTPLVFCVSAPSE